VAGAHLLATADDATDFRAALLDASRECRVAVHAYVVLPDHFHVLATPGEAGDLGRFMQAVGRRFVARHNHRHGRSGSLWAGRFRATVLESARYLLDAMAFIEGHAWRLGLVPGPLVESPHVLSSLGQHLNRRTDPVVTDHAAFWALGNTPFDREAVWGDRLQQGVPASVVQALVQASSKGWALGGPEFLAELERRHAPSGGAPRRLQPARRGRPRKAVAPSAI
jgi:putative transposase